MDNADARDTKRAAVEANYSGQRATREKQYVTDKVALEADYLSDLTDIRVAREQALVAAGLNPDGSDPQGRQQGSTL